MIESFYSNLNLTEEQFWFSIVPLATFFGLGILGVGVFAIRTAIRGLPRSGRIVSQGGTPFLGHFTMEFFYWLIAPITRWFVRHRVSPNTLTTISLIFGLGSGFALAFGWFGLGGWLILLSASFDVFDGMVARARGLSSQSGDYWDSVADRLCDGAAFVGFAFYYRENWAIFAVVCLALVATVMVSYSRAKAECYGVKAYGGVMQRHERVVYLGLGAGASPIIALITEPKDSHPEYWLAIAGIAIVAFFSSYTAIRRVWSAFKGLREREAKERSATGKSIG